MIEHTDQARELQAIERHVTNLLRFHSRGERAAYTEEMTRHYDGAFVERVKAEFLKRWEKR